MSKTATTVEDVCPRCGGPVTTWSCRPVALGFWCAQYGLAEDVSRTRPPTPVSDHPEDRDPAVRAAQAAFETAKRAEEEATSRFETIAVAHLQARSKRHGSPSVSVDGTLVDVVPTGSTLGDLKRHAEAEAEADAERRQAGARTVAARQELEQAVTKARRSLARASV